jgi:hypothetical protein
MRLSAESNNYSPEKVLSSSILCNIRLKSDVIIY